MEMSAQAALCLCLPLLVGLLKADSDSAAVARPGDDAFPIRHASSGKCVLADKQQQLQVAECRGSPVELWKWGTEHRLFHVSSTKCLGLEVRNKVLRLLDCSDPGNMLWWRCLDGAVHTEYRMALAVVNGTITAKRDSADRWTRGKSSKSICQQPYQVMHTTLGNSYGAPCSFPFLYNGSWVHGCLPNDPDDGLSWCSTTADFDVDRKWGHCLKPEIGCKVLWDNSSWGSCYQHNLQSALPWHEARASCRSQGADLLSITTPQELELFSAGGDSPTQVWIGLEQLDMSQGWQWSDGSPLALVHWEEGMPSTAILNTLDCGVMNSKGFWESADCDQKLPYICKKSLNRTNPESSARWVDQPTNCEAGWQPWNGFCYKLEREPPLPMSEAQQRCREMHANLLSVNSLAHVEALSSAFHANDSYDVWTGLRSDDEQVLFHWTDQSPVTFTYWARNQPAKQGNSTCVSYFGKDLLWRTVPCERKQAFMCMRKGEVNDSVLMTGCPEGGDWRRHGKACYKVDPSEVHFKDQCNLTIMNRFEQAFINSLIRDYQTANESYFWIGLQDVKNTGEYQWTVGESPGDRVTYTNWQMFQPDLVGGCAVLSTGKSWGKWEVKNCTSFKAGSICKVEIGPHVPPEPEPDLSLQCSPGWVSSPNVHYCYKVFHKERVSRKRTWEEAEQFCQALGAHLASVSHVDEMKALHDLLRDSVSNVRYFWIGLNRRNPSAEDTWEWSDGRPVSTSIFQGEFLEEDVYNRECTAFKMQVRSTFFLFLNLPLRTFYASPFSCAAQLEWVCQIPRGKTPETPEWYNPDGHHETSIFIDGNEFWFVSKPTLTHEEASLYCSFNHSKLAQPPTINALKQINNQLAKISDSKQNWWVDMEHPGPNHPMISSRLQYYQSVFLGQCSSLSMASIIPEYSYKCKQALPFICEKLNITSVEKDHKPPPTSHPCDGNSVAFRDKCYTPFRPLYTSFENANEHCHTMMGTLLTISSQVEQDFIISALPNLPPKSWIGLRLRLQDTHWVDGSSVNFLNFNPLLLGQVRPIVVNIFEPDSIGMCAYMFNEPLAMMGTWDYASCKEQHYVSVCQRYIEPVNHSMSERNFSVGNHTYHVLLGDMTWAEALRSCRMQGMDLASVPDTFQQASLSVTVNKANTSMWIGLVSKDGGTHYHWTDNSHTVFSRWTSEPTAGDCVYLDTDGFWKATDCMEELAGAICHVPIEETSSTTEQPRARCSHKGSGPNWIPFGNSCYTFQLASTRWGDSGGNTTDTCSKLDPKADILTIRNEAENHFVKDQLGHFKDLVYFVWLGMIKSGSTNSFQWLDGTNVQYSNWKDGRPNVTQPFMVGLRLDGFWELFSNPAQFPTFKQRSIVACKIENDPKHEFKKSPNDTGAYGNWTYYAVQGRMSWFEAAQACGRGGGHLASVHNRAQDAHLGLISRRDGFPLWIGLSNQNESGQSFEWSDGTEYNYRPQEVPSQQLKDHCLSLSPKGSWEFVDCQAKLEGAICYNASAHWLSQRSAEAGTGCPQSVGPSEWVQYEEYCYMFDMAFFNYSIFTMQDARAACKQLGNSAELLAIHNSKENDFVSRYVSENPFITSRVWISTNLSSPGQSADASEVYSNWESGVAGSLQTEPVCGVLMSARGGAWSHVSCREGLGRAVCRAPAYSKGSPVALVFFIIIVVILVGVAAFIIYRKSRARFSSTVRYKRNFDEADSTSIITQTE
ncbi:lymphocyte antigen 75-like [Paramormyrops kingsleyae]|uniref:lymphocyte antigen 75-like n=1 Tax=Paramormyrops kingsleyae TaxID=1676925 RepID=UPI003B96D07F